MIERDETDWLAAQYALGVLDPGERKMVKSRLLRDPALAGMVQDWETRLAPLSLREPGLAPSPRVLEEVLAVVAQDSAASQSSIITAKAPPRRLRWGVQRPALAATIAVIAIALGAILLGRQWHPVEIMSSVLMPEATSPTADEPTAFPRATFTVSFDLKAKALTVRQTGGDVPRADRVHVLWLQPEGAADVILVGQLHGSGPMVTPLHGLTNHDIARGRLLISLEAPAPGSRPRGPVLASGRLHRPP